MATTKLSTTESIDLENTALDVSADDNSDVSGSQAKEPSHPFNWSKKRRWIILILVASSRFLTDFAGAVIVPAVSQILRDLRNTNDVYETFIVSIWELGKSVGPLVYAPLSETYGRRRVYHVGNVLFTLSTLGCALSQNIPMFVAFRFLSGLSSTAYTLGPCIIGDVFQKSERGKTMTVNMAFGVIGSAVGPIAGGYISEDRGWRWTCWMTLLISSTLTLAGFALLPETYYEVISRNQAEKHQMVVQDTGLSPKHGWKCPILKFKPFAKVLVRPVKMLALLPAILILSMYTALTYGVNFLIFTTLSLLMRDEYRFSTTDVSKALLSANIGLVLAMLSYAATSDRYITAKAAQGLDEPENRLHIMLIGSFVVPLGVFIYGWTAQLHAPWIAPLVGYGTMSFGRMLATLGTNNYIVDAYPLHGASALAGGATLSSLLGTFMPLAGLRIYTALGWGWGNSTFGFLAAAFIPLLTLSIVWGKKMRGRAFKQG